MIMGAQLYSGGVRRAERRRLWVAGLTIGLLVSCSTEPGRSFEGTWVLQSVNDTTLPFDYSYTTTEGQLIPGLLLADTLTLSTAGDHLSTDRIWFDRGSGAELHEDLLFVTDQNGDSFIINLPDGQRQAILDDTHLRVQIPDGQLRAGLYDFVRLDPS